MARRRGRRLTRNQKFAGAAVVAGLLLAAGPRSHTGPGRHRERPGRHRRVRRVKRGPGQLHGRRGPLRLDRLADDLPGRLWTRESNFETGATNPQSGAYGIPQSLPAAKMAAAGADWQTNPATQIRWGLGYIAATYGTPCGAWSHEQAAGWY